MRQWLLSLLLMLQAGSLPAFEIPRAYRVANRTSVQCVWASVETLARYHGLTRVCPHLTGEHRGTSGPGGPESILRQCGVAFYAQPQGNRDRRILDYAVSQQLGAAIGLGGRHMVTLVDLQGERMTVIENSDPACATRSMPLSAWDGWALVLLPDYRAGERFCSVHGFG